MNIITIIRITSDNYDTYMSLDAYREVRLSMSTGDFHTHAFAELEVTPDELEDIKFNSELGFIDFMRPDPRIEQDFENCWFIYDGAGDCYVE